ncbi:hypothetical protein CDL15_Pgr019478 [Punica granatum]|uniref:Uncharacterized protein n=1 Tax=Punica granatum TaxID=22663 RepID=A0A218VTL0_PUNGR|nr:hypothetical protein CDL15_Pgr019478 [Punica granatum]
MLLFPKLNRRLFLLVLTTLSVVVSTICILQGEVWERLQLVFELTSYASSCMAMCALLIYTLELFPTCVRNSALSMVRQANVLGRRAFSPVLVEAGGASGGALSYGSKILATRYHWDQWNPFLQ